jgi:hypothetical protein
MDAGTLEQVLYHIHNWFERDALSVTDCKVQDGSLPASVSSQIPLGAWYRVEGSYLNEGLHLRLDEFPEGESEGLTDETFTGTVTVLAIPHALLLVAEEISEWVAATSEARSKALSSPYQSESFGGYSYTVRDVGGSSGSASAGGGGWQAAFASDLSPWRKIS